MTANEIILGWRHAAGEREPDLVEAIGGYVRVVRGTLQFNNFVGHDRAAAVADEVARVLCPAAFRDEKVVKR